SSTLVSDHSASSVIEIEPTAGTFRRASALPQYLISAKFAPARARAAPGVRLEVLIALEPVHRRGNREPRIAPAITEIALGLAAGKIHVLGRHTHAVQSHARLAPRDQGGNLGGDRDWIHEPMRKPDRRGS